MKWQDILANIKAILLAPLCNILCIAGVVLISGSFLDYEKNYGISLHGQFYIGPAIAGSMLIILGLFLFHKSNGNQKNVVIDYNKGIEIKGENLTILIKVGEIQSVGGATMNSIFVLPANTTFVDDCATDGRTALGAFFLNRFPDKVGVLPALFSKLLSEKGLDPDANAQFPAGTTITLPDEFAKPAKVAITASTIRMAGEGITSSPQIICSCVEGIFKSTADLRIDTVYLPILGSGHGGLDRGMALLFLLFAILHFAKEYHHIKMVQIIVHPRDMDSLKQSRELSNVLAQ